MPHLIKSRIVLRKWPGWNLFKPDYRARSTVKRSFLINWQAWFKLNIINDIHAPAIRKCIIVFKISWPKNQQESSWT